MTDEEIRTVVRQVLAARGVAHTPTHAPAGVPHPGFLRLHMVLPTEPGSPCVIEAAVTCNNCGYCLSHGY
ncbi:MAG: hypothetical protein JJE40_11625 [Vicinamibacteria bacterium]|nr:hypothetical protein [Vicinamibacteria bacterium]